MGRSFKTGDFFNGKRVREHWFRPKQVLYGLISTPSCHTVPLANALYDALSIPILLRSRRYLWSEDQKSLSGVRETTDSKIC
jgi:hypothetical protein